jgi:hypothetical protein
VRFVWAVYGALQCSSCLSWFADSTVIATTQTTLCASPHQLTFLIVQGVSFTVSVVYIVYADSKNI